MSRFAKARGSAFESLVEQHWMAYDKQGVCKVEKVDPPTRMAGKFLIQLDNPFLDYVGSWTERGGRMIVIEAKTTLEPRLPILGKSGGMTEKQIESFKRWHAMKAAVAVLWQHDDEIRLVHSIHIEEAEWNQRKSIRWDQADKIPRGKGFLLFDWMKSLRELYP